MHINIKQKDALHEKEVAESLEKKTGTEYYNF